MYLREHGEYQDDQYKRDGHTAGKGLKAGLSAMSHSSEPAHVQLGSNEVSTR